jgi:hypothetical protein
MIKLGKCAENLSLTLKEERKTVDMKASMDSSVDITGYGLDDRNIGVRFPQ